ncbi:ester cyclase [Planotetraspora sp. GP83]|uniref:ester cyclase n=1 Tax=Planotetraspora sp. GP83 TaxID=3156264 RepID=UPI003514D152
MFSKKSPKAAFAPVPKRRRVIGAMTGLAVAATLGAAIAIPAEAQSQGSHDASSGYSSHHHPKSPRQVAAAFYASYNGDLAAGFERYISKKLVLHGFDGPNSRDAWLQGDLELKASLTGYKLEVLDQIAEGDKVVTRWVLGGVHTGTILGIPPSGRKVSLSGISIDRVVGGQSVEHWSEGNFGRFLDELRGETPSAK